MAKPKIPDNVVQCMLCGDKGLVYRAYVDKTVDAVRARTLVACPRCRPLEKEKK